MNKRYYLLVICIVLLLVYPFLWNSNIIPSLIPKPTPAARVAPRGNMTYVSSGGFIARIGMGDKLEATIKEPYLFGYSYVPVVIKGRNLRWNLFGDMGVSVHDLFVILMSISIVSSIGMLIFGKDRYKKRKVKEVRKDEFERW